MQNSFDVKTHGRCCFSEVVYQRINVDKFVLKFIKCEPFAVFVVRVRDGEDDFMFNIENPRRIPRTWFYGLNASGYSRLNIW